MDFAVVGEVIAGRYELQELVGTGGMSNVYRAHDRLLERTVALKLLHDRYSDDDEYVERFRREARAAARLSHPDIVTVIDRGERDGRQFIVFEHVEGETLKDVVMRSGPLPVKRVIELGLHIARALAFAHSHDLIHRDVKPQNVLLDGDGRAKLTDFGIVRSLGIEEATTTGTVVGTSHYIAPEQARGEPVDGQSDVYSLGAVLYEMLTGEVPFPGDNFVTVALRHMHDPVPNLLERRPDAPSLLAAVVERALQKDPHDRFETMDEFGGALAACLAQHDPEPEAATTLTLAGAACTRRSPGPRRRRRWLLALAVVLSAGGAAAVLLTPSSRHASIPTVARGPMLSPGEGGTAVRTWQAALNAWLRGAHPSQPELALDGHFGTRTETLTKAFQLEHHLQPDGIVGPETRRDLQRALRD